MRVNKALSRLLVPVSTLKEDPKNARKHGDRNLTAITASLKEFGQQKPIVVLKGVVIAGNGTLRAAKALGWKEIAAVQFDDPAKARAYAIADNRTAELAEWEPEALGDVIAGLEKQGLNVADVLQFSADEVAAIISASKGTMPEEFPEIGEDLEVTHKCPKCGYEFSGGAIIQKKPKEKTKGGKKAGK